MYKQASTLSHIVHPSIFLKWHNHSMLKQIWMKRTKMDQLPIRTGQPNGSESNGNGPEQNRKIFWI